MMTAPLRAETEFIVKGLEGALLENAQAHLSTVALECNATQWQAEAVELQARRALQTSMRALGHYHAKIATAAQRDDTCWKLRFTVSPGPAVTIALIDIAISGPGSTDPKWKQLVDASGLRRGDTLNQGKYDALKSQLQRYAYDHGYFDARFEQKSLLIDPENDRATIRLHFATGRQYLFGPTTIESKGIDPALVRGFLSYKAGEPFSSASVLQSQNALTDSGYFQAVLLSADTAARTGGSVPMRLHLEAAKRYALHAGAGYATDTGLRLNATLHNRRVNRDGHRYTLLATLSKVESQLGITYEIPLEHPRTDWLVLSGGYRYEDTASTFTHGWSAGVSHAHLLSSLWLRRIFVQYLHELSLYPAKQTTQLLYPGVGFSRTRTDRLIYPNLGWSVTTQVTGSVRNPLSSTGFAQGTIDLKGILPLFEGHLFGRVDLGATDVKNIDRLPVALRFYAGGDSSVRGYAYKSLGPVDSKGNVIGGKYLLTASTEYDHRLYGDVYLALFFDAGNAYDALPLKLYRSAGAGVHWHSPIGPIRIDVAHPFDNPDTAFRIHISMGPRF